MLLSIDFLLQMFHLLGSNLKLGIQSVYLPFQFDLFRLPHLLVGVILHFRDDIVCVVHLRFGASKSGRRFADSDELQLRSNDALQHLLALKRILV